MNYQFINLIDLNLFILFSQYVIFRMNLLTVYKCIYTPYYTKPNYPTVSHNKLEFKKGEKMTKFT